MERIKDGWVLKLKDDAKEEGMEGDYYYQDEDYAEFLVQELSEATIIYDKDTAIAEMQQHEKDIIGIFGKDAICNAGYTNMMRNFEWFEVEVEEVEW